MKKSRFTDSQIIAVLKQTEHGLRHLRGDGRKAFVLRTRMAGQAIEAAPDLVQQASSGQPRQDDPGRVNGVQIAGAQQPLLAGQSEDALDVGTGEHGCKYVPFIRRMQLFDE